MSRTTGNLHVKSAIFALICCVASSAQTSQGTIAGSVLDPSGAGVDGAKVTATNLSTGGVTATATSSGGSFRFPSLLVGKYNVSVTAPGFQTVTQTGIDVLVSNTTAVNITMSVGAVTESLQVRAQVTSIESESSDVGTVIDSRQVLDLPLALGGVGAMRSPEAFMFLAPGVTGPGTANSNNGIFISKTGAGQNFGNEVLLDGASTLRAENGSSFDEAGPSVESLREFKILTSTFPAEYDHTTGGVESFTTKGGGNSFHGTAYDILKNEVFNANSWFNNAYGTHRPIDKKNDYGVNLGGPVIIPRLYNGRDKTFFFFNWEQYRENAGGTAVSTVLTEAERRGDLSSFLTQNQIGTNACDGSPIFAGQIFDPATTKTGPNGLLCRTAFPGNIIPTNRFSQVSQNALTYMPASNRPGLTNANGVVANNFIFSAVNPLFNTTYQIRIDQSVSDAHKVWFTYHSRENTRYAGTQVAPAPIDPGGWPQDFITHYVRAGWDYTISPSMVNTLNLGFNRTNSINVASAVSESSAGNFSWAEKLGIRNITSAPGRQFPNIGMGESILGLGRGNQDDLIDGGLRFNEQLTWIRGKHSLAFGADVRTQLFSPFNLGQDSGYYNFGRAQTAATQALSANTGNGVASFLLGDLGNSGRQITGHVARWTQQYFAVYVKDDFKIRPNLTLNLGLRWNLDIPRKESRNDTSNFDPTAPNPAAGGHPGALVFANNCTGCNPKWADTYYKAFAPRIGFAWTPGWFSNRMVVRGGYGIYYSPLQYTDFGGRMQQGFSASPSVSSPDSFTRAFNWDTGFPDVTLPPSLNPSQKNGQSGMDYIKPEYGQPGKIQSWTIQIQQQLGKDMIGTLGYVGQRSDHLRSAIDTVYNIPWSKTALGDQLFQNINNNTAGVPLPYAGFTGNVQQALRPFPQYQWIYTDVLQNRGTAAYDALQATLERRFAAGLQTQVSFTWQKTITDSDSLLPGINGGIAQVQNPQDLSLDRSVSSQDVPVMFTASWIYELPFGKGKQLLKEGVAAAIFGGWQIGGLLRYQSGIPTTFCGAAGIPGWDQCIRFDRVAGQSILTTSATSGSFDPFKDRQFNRAAFADPNAGRTGNTPFRLGNFPRNNTDARSWGYKNEDFSIIRTFRIREPLTFQLKGELLNAFNRHIFSAGNQGVNDPNFGLVTGTIDGPRNVQFTFRVNF
jgi:hypothetical protein